MFNARSCSWTYIQNYPGLVLGHTYKTIQVLFLDVHTELSRSCSWTYIQNYPGLVPGRTYRTIQVLFLDVHTELSRSCYWTYIQNYPGLVPGRIYRTIQVLFLDIHTKLSFLNSHKRLTTYIVNGVQRSIIQYGYPKAIQISE